LRGGGKEARLGLYGHKIRFTYLTMLFVTLPVRDAQPLMYYRFFRLPSAYKDN
jgi:hypothetical protein